jgi:hypothetical protein
MAMWFVKDYGNAKPSRRLGIVVALLTQLRYTAIRLDQVNMSIIKACGIPSKDSTSRDRFLLH